MKNQLYVQDTFKYQKKVLPTFVSVFVEFENMQEIEIEWPNFESRARQGTLPTAEIISAKNARAWVSMVS